MFIIVTLVNSGIVLGLNSNSNQKLTFRDKPAGQVTALSLASKFTTHLLEIMTNLIVIPFVIR